MSANFIDLPKIAARKYTCIFISKEGYTWLVERVFILLSKIVSVLESIHRPIN